jgi:RHS repeat-associated protein
MNQSIIRVYQSKKNETIIFTYDLNGQLMEEYNLKTKDVRNYIYADGKLIAFIDDDGDHRTYSSKVYYVVSNHLNAPLLVMNEAGAQVWSATYDAFGKATITATNNMKLNLRADGQYEDSETGLYYNWYRYYNPSLGRYITSNRLQ